MSEPSTRPPTPASSWTSPLAIFSNGNLYPYWDLKDTYFRNALNAVRRTFAFMNPMSSQQVPTMQRAAIGIFNGSEFYQEDKYPNSITFSNRYPSHYDPLADKRFEAKPHLRHATGELTAISRNVIPRFCTRQISIYKRCLVANDQRSDVCKQQQDNIMSICPTFALDILRQKKLASLKAQAMDNNKYREVMKVSDYNQGRTVADVPLRDPGYSRKQNLRPSTLWADDRYADITEEEVKAAQERVNKRRAANPQPRYENKVYDRKYEVPPKNETFYL